MKRTVLADTGPLFAALDPDDRHHARAQEEIQKLEQLGLGVAVTYPTLLEGYSLVLYKLGIHAAHAWLAELLNGAVLLNPPPEDYQRAQRLLLRFRDQPFSLFDAVVATVSQRLRTPVWTYDHHFDVMRVDVWRGHG